GREVRRRPRAAESWTLRSGGVPGARGPPEEARCPARTRAPPPGARTGVAPPPGPLGGPRRGGARREPPRRRAADAAGPPTARHSAGARRRGAAVVPVARPATAHRGRRAAARRPT